MKNKEDPVRVEKYLPKKRSFMEQKSSQQQINNEQIAFSTIGILA